MPSFEYVFTDLTRIPDEIIKTKDRLGALRSTYLALQHTFDELPLRENFHEMLIFVSHSGNSALDVLLTEMVFTYIQKRLQLEPEELEKMIETLPGDSKLITMSTYDKVIAKGTEKGIEKGIEIKAHEFVINLIRSTDWENARIAKVAGVQVALVQEIREQLQREAE